LRRGNNSRTRISGNDGEMGGNKERYRMERKFLSYYWSVGSGLGKPWFPRAST